MKVTITNNYKVKNKVELNGFNFFQHGDEYIVGFNGDLLKIDNVYFNIEDISVDKKNVLMNGMKLKTNDIIKITIEPD